MDVEDRAHIGYWGKDSKKLALMTVILLVFAAGVQAAGISSAGAAGDYEYTPAISAPEDYTRVYVNSVLPSSFTCAATQSYGISAPPGTNGLAPQVTLAYNSHNAGELGSIVGSGWTLTQNYIQRDVNGTPDDTGDDEYTLNLNNRQHKLVELVRAAGVRVYKTRADAFMQVRREKSPGQCQNKYCVTWTVVERDGTRHVFGSMQNSEAENSVRNQVWRWYLTKTVDTHGNAVFYEYAENPHAGDIGAVYPKTIEYNNDRKRKIEFILEDTDRPDIIPHYVQGSLVQYSRRIKEVRATVDGKQVRGYTLEYETNPAKTKSLLVRITPVGSDNTTLPPAEYTYESEQAGWVSGSTPTMPGFYSDQTYRAASRLVDANNDGRVDILVGAESQQIKDAWINDGNTWVRDETWDTPVTFAAGPGSSSPGFEMPHAFGDVNGDGRVDIITNGGTWVNTGAGWSWDAAYNPPAEPLSRMGVYTTDLNGDGRVDFIQGLLDNGNLVLKAWINNGGGWTESAKWSPPTHFNHNYIGNSGWRFRRTSLTLADVNGDGLPDLINETTAFVNNGGGWTRDDRHKPPLSPTTGGVRVGDVNGDGLDDIIRSYSDHSGTIKEAWINNGTGYTKNADWEPDVEFASNLGGGVIVEGSYFSDPDGNGITDILGERSNQNTLKPGILVKARNTFGGETSVEYTPSTGFDNTGGDGVSDLSQKLWCIKKTTEDNMMAGDQRLKLTVRYSFADGVYDPVEREFRGFGESTEDKEGVVVVEHRYHQDTARQGRESQTKTGDGDGNPYLEVDYTWTSVGSRGVYAVELTQVDEKQFDGSSTSPRTIRTRYAYDAHGNIIEEVEGGDVSLSGDERRTVTSYVVNAGANILDKPSTRTVYSGSMRESEAYFSYDGRAYGSPPTRGDVTRIERWLDTGAGNPAIQYAYDSYGNIVNVTDPLERVTRYVYGVSDATHTFPERKINALNHAIDWRYDLGSGNLLNATDADGHTTQYAYDGFGRITSVVKPGDSASYPTVEYAYGINASPPQSVETRRREQAQAAGSLDSIQYLDGFGRVMQSKGESEGRGFITQNLFYDEVGRLEGESIPHYTGGYSHTHPANVLKSHHHYDPLGRRTRTVNSDGTVKTTGFDRGVETITDENGHQKVYVRDGLDRIIRVDELNGGETYSTTYEYNSRGDLTRIVNHEGDVVEYTYDTLGRKTRTSDPDLGVWVYAYDLAGNKIRSTDSRGVTIQYEFDDLNRIVRENRPADGIVDYSYDTGFYGTRRGRLMAVTQPASIREFDYDARGRKTREWLRLDGRDFYVSLAYDSIDRVTQKTVSSDNTILSQNSYTFNNQGLLESITGVLDDVDYNEYGKPTVRDAAGGLRTNLLYYSNNSRLARIYTQGVQSILYGYDKAGNIVKVTDEIAGELDSYVYDDLDRLVEAGSPEASLTYAYTAIGNIASLNNTGEVTEFTYGRAGAIPHAVTGISEQGGVCAGSLPPLTGLWFVDLNTLCSADTITVSGELRLDDTLTLEDATLSFA